MQVDDRVSKLLDDKVEDIGPIKAGDMVMEVEMLDKLQSVPGEPVNEVAQVKGDLVRIVQELLESILARVVETVPRDLKNDRVLIFDLELLDLREDLVLGGFQGGVHTPHHRQRQDHLAIFMLLVIVTKQIRHAPDEVDLVLEIDHDEYL